MRILISTLIVLCSTILYAQEYIPLSLTGYNADCVYDLRETLSSQTAIDKDNLFYSASRKSSGGLPTEITSKIYGVPYVFSNFGSKNTLRLNSKDTTYQQGTLTLETQVKAEILFLLGVSANGDKEISVNVNYNDGTSEPTQRIRFHDWFGGKEKSALWGLSRINKGSGSYDSRREFGVFEAILPVNNTKTIKSITFKAGDGEGSYSALFAITAVNGYAFDNCEQLFLINNSHLDTQWNWDITTTIDQYVKATLTDNFSYIEKYPWFHFNFEGAAKYNWMKEYYPNEYEKLKEYIAQGRWSLAGAAWDANETMISSSESLLRNLLYGQIFYKKEFGRKGGTDIMLPDCFGFSAALPSIAHHCGITGFHTQKLSWGSAYDHSQLPEFGKWRGIDGNEIYCILKPGPYDKNFNENLAFSTNMHSDIIENEKGYGLRAAFRYTGKSGDRGGALNKEHVEWLDKSINSNGPVKVQLISPTQAFDYMKQHDRGEYKVVDHELPMRTHGVGCYTSQTMMKYWNRKNELMGDAAERSAIMANTLGGMPYPHNTLTEAWKRVILHQFHDDLPGTSIPKAYYYSHNDELLSLQEFHRTTNLAVGTIAKQMNTETEHTPVVVYNPLSIDRNDIIEGEISSPHVWKGIQVKDAFGNPLPCQLTRFAEGKQGFIFAGHVPSMGFATFDVEELSEIAHTSSSDSTFTISENQMENNKYRVTLNAQTGDIKSIYDKKIKQELLNSPLRFALFPCKSASWPAWEILYNTLSSTPFYVNNTDGTLHISIAEDGPLRKSFRIERTRFGSTFVQYIRLTKTGSDERVDVVNEIDWQSKGYLLKLDIKLRASNSNTTFDNSLGYLQRGISTSDYYEYAAHQWVDHTNTTKTYGVSILNDSKYGWDKPANNHLRMSIVYSPEVENNYNYQQFQDLGLNRFQYSIYSHEGELSIETMWQAERLNRPLMAYATKKYKGELGSTLRFAEMNTKDVAIKALKQAEEDDASVIRFQELSGKAQKGVTVTFPTGILSADEVNGIEEYKGTANHTAHTLTFDIDAFSLKTFKIRFNKTQMGTNGSPNNPENISYPCELAYNADVISLDDKKYDGNTGTLGHLIPGELLPDSLLADGVTFKFGPSTAGKKNAVQCKGQTISLPTTHNGGKLYLLAFSTDAMGSETAFSIDNEQQKLQIDYAMGTVGEWGTEFTSAKYSPTEVAFTATHSHHITERKNKSYQYVYVKKYALHIAEGASTLTLPNNSKVYLMAATIAQSPYESVTPLHSNQHIFPTAMDVPSVSATCGECLSPTSVTASGYTNANEMPKFAADGNPYTKWCDNKSGDKWIIYNFGKDVKICQWEAILAASEGFGYIARSMRLQYYDSQTSKYVDVDEVTENTDNHLLRGINPIITKRVRLQLTSPEQNGATARLYSLNFYGTENLNTKVEQIATDTNKAPQPIFDLSGKRVGTTVFRYGKWYHPNLPAGIYIIKGCKVQIR